jgi:hypothetical protein
MKWSFHHVPSISYGRKVLWKLPWFLGRHMFLFLLLLILTDLIFGGYLLYKHVISATMQEESGSMVTSFKQSTYQSILQTKESREAALEMQSIKTYQNPFK